MDKAINQAFNDQIQEEFYSAYIYLSMATYCESIDLGGFAHWMQNQYKEELDHANRIYEFVHDLDGRVELKAIGAPPTEWASPLAVFEAALAHEQHITGCINKLMSLCVEKQDHASQVFLQWFITEQVEEEKTARDIINDLKRIGDSQEGILMIDRELAQRVPEAE